MKKDRLHYSILNSSISSVIYMLRLIMQFAIRTVFIHFLGKEFLGLNGLFTNILSLLSMAELGIGSSIVYSMYKPLAVGDQPKIRALMQLYKKAYNYIGFLVGIIGLGLIPFLKYMITSDIEMSTIYIIYILFLANSVVSYFFTYKRSMLIADQRTYVTTINDFIFLIVTTVVQILFLFWYPNYVLYLTIQILFTFIGNLSISRITDKEYPYLLDKHHEKLDKETITEIKKNVIGNVSSKIGGVIVMGTDNILISSFVSLTAVGLYSNYTLIVNSVQNLCKQVTNSITASIGNYAATNERSKGYELFKKHFFVNHTLIFFSTVILFNVLNDFIVWWLGDTFVLTEMATILVIVNYAIQVYRNTGFVFIESYGLYWYQRKKAIIEAFINLAASLLLLIVFRLGITGVLLGTIISSFGFVIWYEAYIIYKYAFNLPMWNYVKKLAEYLVQIAIASGTSVWLLNRFFTGNPSFTGIIAKVILSVVIGLAWYLLFNFRKNEFRYILRIFQNLLRRGK
ncbi:lipopolysaccharide biosynthesis protein [Enterococcus asini]|uniref:lipopolysaccharide biosynthesis protein n=1 Tax=Enterococcus asini TaxID=57732 RepID=UPI000E4C71BA|nr:transporter [Enterococcus asini]RGW13258.1 transporter [Enterococcus asini]